MPLWYTLSRARLRFPARVAHVRRRTGLDAADFRAQARAREIGTHREVMEWLEREYGLEGEDACAVADAVINAERVNGSRFSQPRGALGHLACPLVTSRC